MADHTTYGLVCSELSEDLSKTNLGELKLDSFQDNSVKIKIKAASLNFPDLLMTQGKYQNRPNLPFALGMEGAGIVEKVGSCLLYTSPSPRDGTSSRMPSSA